MDTSYIKNLKIPIAIIGLGKSGRAAYNLLITLGFKPVEIITFDENNKDAQVSSSHSLEIISPKTLIVSPGVSLKSDYIQRLRAGGAHISSEISLAASLLTTEKLIGVTGSLGKSTVTSLLGAGALSFSANTFVGGNLGVPFCDYALKILRGETRAEWAILELSSYQLENCETLRLNHSIITYLSANHLERYDSIDDYYATKLKITSLTDGICLFNKTSVDAEKNSAYSKCDRRLINAASFSRPDLLSDIFLIGTHNKDNFALAAEMAHVCGWPESATREMSRYRGLAHRLEFVATLNGITYVNDSKATAMDSVLVAVRACSENLQHDQRLYLLLGGRDKNLPWQDLAILKTNEKITPVFFGDCAALAKEKSTLDGEVFSRLGSAINFCQKRARRGDTVLLSPGGTSLDEFKNFEERGDFFKTLVLSHVEA